MAVVRSVLLLFTASVVLSQVNAQYPGQLCSSPGYTGGKVTKWHRLDSGDYRCCVDIKCFKGTQAVACREDDPTSSTCKECEGDTFQGHQRYSSDMYKCVVYPPIRGTLFDEECEYQYELKTVGQQGSCVQFVVMEMVVLAIAVGIIARFRNYWKSSLTTRKQQHNGGLPAGCQGSFVVIVKRIVRVIPVCMCIHCIVRFRNYIYWKCYHSTTRKQQQTGRDEPLSVSNQFLHGHADSPVRSSPIYQSKPNDWADTEAVGRLSSISQAHLSTVPVERKEKMDQNPAKDANIQLTPSSTGATRPLVTQQIGELRDGYGNILPAQTLAEATIQELVSMRQGVNSTAQQLSPTETSHWIGARQLGQPKDGNIQPAVSSTKTTALLGAQQLVQRENGNIQQRLTCTNLNAMPHVTSPRATELATCSCSCPHRLNSPAAFPTTFNITMISPTIVNQGAPINEHTTTTYNITGSQIGTGNSMTENTTVQGNAGAMGQNGTPSEAGSDDSNSTEEVCVISDDSSTASEESLPYSAASEESLTPLLPN